MRYWQEDENSPHYLPTECNPVMVRRDSVLGVSQLLAEELPELCRWIPPSTPVHRSAGLERAAVGLSQQKKGAHRSSRRRCTVGYPFPHYITLDIILNVSPMFNAEHIGLCFWMDYAALKLV